MSGTSSEPAPSETPVEAGATVVTPVKPTAMLAKERQVGWLVVAVALGGVLASHASAAYGGDQAALGAGALGVGFVVLMAGAVWYGHRIWAGFASILAGFSPLKANLVSVSLLCLGYGGYLVFRVSRAQSKAAAARPRGTAGGRGGRAGASGRDGQAGPASRGAGRSRSRAGASGPAVGEAGHRPSANRRYTPPRAKGFRRGR